MGGPLLVRRTTQQSASLTTWYPVPVLCALWSILWLMHVPSGLHADDHILLEGLSPVFTGIKHAWTAEVLGSGVDYFYRPATFSVLAIAGWLDSPLALHSVSALLHLVVCLLVYQITDVLFADKSRAVLAMCIMMFHQAVVMPVFWVSAMGDLLMTCFGLLAYLEFVRHRPVHMAAWLSLSLFSKETAVTIPAILLLSTLLRGDLRLKNSLILLSAILTGCFLVMRYMLLHTVLAGDANNLYFDMSIKIVPRVLRYFLEIASPLPLSSIPLKNVPIVALPALACWGIAFHAAFKRDRSIRIGLSAAMIVLPLVPVFAVFGKWYLYSPTALLAIVVAHAPFSRLACLWVSTIICGGYAAIHFYSMCFAESERIQQRLLTASQSIEEPVSSAQWPALVCKDVPVFTWHRQKEAAFKRQFGVSKRFKD